MWLFVEVGKKVGLAGIDVCGVCVYIVTLHGACPWEEEISMHQHVGAWLFHPHCSPPTMAFPASEAFLPLCLTETTWASTHHFLGSIIHEKGRGKRLRKAGGGGGTRRGRDFAQVPAPIPSKFLFQPFFSLFILPLPLLCISPLPSSSLLFPTPPHVFLTFHSFLCSSPSSPLCSSVSPSPIVHPCVNMSAAWDDPISQLSLTY